MIFDQAVEVPLVLGREQWYDPDRPEAMIAIVDKFAGPEAAKTARLAFEGP